MTATNENPFQKKVAGSPTPAISTPPIAGPITFPVSWMTLLSMTAFVSCATGTISLGNDCRAGLFSASTTPPASAKARTPADIDVMGEREDAQ